MITQLCPLKMNLLEYLQLLLILSYLLRLGLVYLRQLLHPRIVLFPYQKGDLIKRKLSILLLFDGAHFDQVAVMVVPAILQIACTLLLESLILVVPGEDVTLP